MVVQGFCQVYGLAFFHPQASDLRIVILQDLTIKQAFVVLLGFLHYLAQVFPLLDLKIQDWAEAISAECKTESGKRS